jgi:predicted ATP-dependent protease
MLPKENENDIEEIPATVRNELELIPVSHIDEVLFEALKCRKPQDFTTLLENKAVRDELLYAEEKKKGDERGEKGDGSDKAPSAGIVAH